MPSRSPNKRARASDAADAEVQLKPITKRTKTEPFESIGYTTAGPPLVFATPVKVLHRITAYLHTIPYDTPSHKDPSNAGYYLRPRTLERTNTLRAMSQTCQSWREALLPLLWRDVECGSITRPESKCQWFLQCAPRLIRICGGLGDAPELALHTRNIRLVISTHRLREALASLVKCLGACRQLKVINVHFAQAEIAMDVKLAFEGLIFPSVETMILPTQMHNLLRCCPNVKRVMCHQGDGSQIITAMRQACKSVEVLCGIRSDRSIVERLAKAAPCLRELRFGWQGDISTKEMLKILKELKTLKVLQIGRSPLPSA
ncbi:hypothetical protein NMY22_g12947 [Coprinellus aureogranulatus]|nr:hypothetical protein NMY22_g12947 [Coprinellus aureogranulatus]